jgi:chromosomal replication initiation ATPase DnaA
MAEGDAVGLEELGVLAKSLAERLGVPDGTATAAAPSDAERRRRDEAALAKDAADREAARREYALAVLPPKLRATLATGCIELTAATRAVDLWMADRSARVLMIRGGVGVGKSVAAAWAVTLSVDAGRRSVSWHRPNDFVSAVLHAYDGHAPRLGGDLVVIDDVGRETKADFCEALCAFIDDHAASVLLTTNLTKEQFRDRYDVRLIDRLREVGRAVDVKGASRRGKSEEF